MPEADRTTHGWFRDAFWATFTAGVLASFFETLYAVAAGWDHPLHYFALCAAFTLALSALLGVAFGRSQRMVPFGLPVWASIIAGLQSGLGLGLVVGATTWGVMWFVGRHTRRAVALGIGVSGALCWALVIFPRIMRRLPVASAPDFVGEILGPTIFFAVALLCLVAVSEILARAGLPKAGQTLSAGLVLLLAGVPFLTSRDLPDYTHLQFESVNSSPDLPNVLLLVMDTVRADHLSVYGYGRSTTPELEAFLARHPRAVVYPRAFSNSNWTVPSHASLLSGLLPSDHGAHFGAGSQFDFVLSAEVSIAERLRGAGYSTVGVFANPWLHRVEGMSRGFQVYFKPIHPAKLPLVGESIRHFLVPGIYPEAIDRAPDATRVNQHLLRAFEACSTGPCFLFANYIEAHSFYVPSPGCRGRFAKWSVREQFDLLSIHDSEDRTARLEARYDEEICSLDRAIAALLLSLEGDGLLEHTWVFITSDHGEAFGDHQVTEHGTSVYNDQVHIPLIVLPPEGTDLQSTDQPVSLVDVAATIIAIAGADPVGPGRDLRSSAASDSKVQIEFFGDASKAMRHGPLAAEAARAVVMGHHKLIEHAKRLELYDLRSDPAEHLNLAPTQTSVLIMLQRELPPLQVRPESKARKPRSISERDLEELRALGYVE